MIRMFGGLLNPIKWIFRNTPYLGGFSSIMFLVSLSLASTRGDFPFLLKISLFSFFNVWIFIKEYRINKQLEILQIQIDKFNKIEGMINIIIFGLWEIMVIFLIGSRYHMRFILPILPIIIVIPTILTTKSNYVVRNQYDLGYRFRKFINEDKLSAVPIQGTVYINFRRAWPGKGNAQIDWILENGKKKKWFLNLANSGVISYLSNLINKPQTTFVNGIPVYTQHENTHVSAKIRNFVRTA